MEKELGTVGAVVGMVALCVLFGGLASAIYPGWPAVGLWLSRADAPAWVQAVGSVLTILFAVRIAAWQNQRAQALAAAERHGKALVMVQTISVLTDLYASEAHSINAAMQRPVAATNSFLSRVQPESQFRSTEQSALAIPLHDLPDVASVELAISLLNHIRATRSVIAASKVEYERGEGDWAPILNSLQVHADAAKALQVEARKAVSRIAASPR